MAALAEQLAAKPKGRPKAVKPSAWPYRFEIVALDALAVDDAYQRPLTSFWKQVSEHFNPALVGCLVVSERKRGERYIIDGQTRWEAMKTQPQFAVPGHGAPCLIYEGLTRAQEADLFAELQTQRRGMSTYHRFRAQLIAGRPLAVGVAGVVTAAGFQLDVVEQPYTLRAIAALEKAYKVDPDHLADVLGITRDVWGTENREAVAAQIISGLSTFVRRQQRLDYDRLRDRLRDVTPSLLQNRASQIREGRAPGSGGQATSMAQAITAEYTRKKR